MGSCSRSVTALSTRHPFNSPLRFGVRSTRTLTGVVCVRALSTPTHGGPNHPIDDTLRSHSTLTAQECMLTCAILAMSSHRVPLLRPLLCRLPGWKEDHRRLELLPAVPRKRLQVQRNLLHPRPGQTLHCVLCCSHGHAVPRRNPPTVGQNPLGNRESARDH